MYRYGSRRVGRFKKVNLVPKKFDPKAIEWGRFEETPLISNRTQEGLWERFGKIESIKANLEETKRQLEYQISHLSNKEKRRESLALAKERLGRIRNWELIQMHEYNCRSIIELQEKLKPTLPQY